MSDYIEQLLSAPTTICVAEQSKGWFDYASLVTQAAIAVFGLLAVLVAILHYSNERRAKRKEHQPILAFRILYEDDDETIHIVLQNDGLGPAFYERIEYELDSESLDGSEFDIWYELNSRVFPGFHLTGNRAHEDNGTLIYEESSFPRCFPVGEVATVQRFETGSQSGADHIRDVLANLKIRVYYKSIYMDKEFKCVLNGIQQL